MKNNIYDTFQEAFIGNIVDIYNNFEHSEYSRIGLTRETLGYKYTVNNAKSYVFENQSLGRINYEYAEDFFNWMMNGSTESDTQLLSAKYPSLKHFLDKPKSSELPDNFNVFYGPRLLRQIPIVLDELRRSPNSRRAVLSILSEDDLQLLDKDETLEFPCCDSAQLLIRGNKLNMHVHMRSNNMANVVKLDMYIWGRLLCILSDMLNLETGKFISTIGSAHVFEKDVEYLKTLNIL